MKLRLSLILLLINFGSSAQALQIIDADDLSPIAFATVSFGDGLGSFADEEGLFTFSTKKYVDIDTLYISAMGYTEKAVPTNFPDPSSAQMVALNSEVSELEEVIVSAQKKGKFKFRKRKAFTHNDIFTCWLPTVESEIAVLFKPYEEKSTQISKLYLPVNAESEYKSKGKGKFATLFRIQFYENQNGFPGTGIPYRNIVFAIDEKEDEIFELDLLSEGVFIPNSGVFVSLQVLGYARPDGKLMETKKYREIKTSRGIQKISTAFRPLLPFVKGEANKNTFVRRIFLNDKKWQIFDKSYNPNSQLIKAGHRNYGMGAEFKVWED